jgi:excisionase family DNA binding protein
VTKNAPPSNAPELLTTRQVAEILKLDEKTVRRMHGSGRLVGSRLSDGAHGHLRFKREDVEAFLEKQKGR